MTDEEALARGLAQLVAPARDEGDPVALVHDRAHRLQRRRRRKVTAAAGVTSLVIVTAVVVVFPGSRSETAYANWTPRPSALSDTERRAAILGCERFAFANDAAEQANAEVLGPPSPRPLAPSLQPVIVERRGQGTGTVMTGAGRFLVCFAAPDTDGSAGGGHIPVSHLEASSARILTGGQAIDLDTGEHTVTTVAGQVGSDVATVDIVRTRGSEVNATVAHGWFFAWWPTDSRAKRLHLSLRDGSHLDLPVD